MWDIIQAYEPSAQAEHSFSDNKGRDAKTTGDPVPAGKGASVPFESETGIMKNRISYLDAL